MGKKRVWPAGGDGSRGRLAAGLIGMLLLSFPATASTSPVPGSDGSWTIANHVLQLTVDVRAGRLAGDLLQRVDGSGPRLRSDGGFSLELTWTDWSAPGKAQNADNPVVLDQGSFLFEKAETMEAAAAASCGCISAATKRQAIRCAWCWPTAWSRAASG